MPYNRAQRILSNFMPSSMPGGSFGVAMGVEEGFYQPEANWSMTPPQGAEATGQPQPSQPPEGAAPAGRTGVQQDPAAPAAPVGGTVASPSAATTMATPVGREVLRQSSFTEGVQQSSGVKQPLSQARRYGL